MKNLLITLLSFFFVLAAAAGCCSLRHLPERTSVRDSVAVTYKESTVIRYVDVEVPVPAESIRVVVPDSSHLETSVAVSDASVDSLGRLHHSLQNKAAKLTAQVPVKDEYHELTVTDKSEEKHTVIEYVEKSLTRWQSFRLKAFWWMLGIIVAGIALRIARKYLL